MYNVILGSDTLVQSTCWHSDKPSCLFHDKASSRAEVLQRYLLFIHVIIIHVSVVFCRPGRSVGIAAAYGLVRTGIESRWSEIFRTCPDRHWGPTGLLFNGYRVFPGSNLRPGRDADPSPLLVQRSKIEYSYTSTLPKGLRGVWKVKPT